MIKWLLTRCSPWRGTLPQLKSGRHRHRACRRRRRQRGSRSGSLSSSGHRSPLITSEWLAVIVRAIDQDPANALLAHFVERDFLDGGGHSPPLNRRDGDSRK
jgi:hypothetical protein